MIPEPQKTHLLELLTALGPSAEDFESIVSVSRGRPIPSVIGPVERDLLPFVLFFEWKWSPVGLRVCTYVRSGLRILIPAKCFSLSVTTRHPFASAVAAMIMPRALRGFPEALPSFISRAHTKAA